MSSIFTRIINREIPADILYEDDLCIVILDIQPVRLGHTLVIPKQELAWMEMYDDSTVAYCMIIAKRMMAHMKSSLHDIHFVYMVVEGLEIPHRHIHLIPYETHTQHPSPERTSYSHDQQSHYVNSLSTNLSD